MRKIRKRCNFGENQLQILNINGKQNRRLVAAGFVAVRLVLQLWSATDTFPRCVHIIAPKGRNNCLHMKIYLSPSQKSSDPADSSLKVNYGLSRSVALWAVRAGLVARLRIYEACLRLGMENMLISAHDLIAWLGAHGIKISMATAQRALVDSHFFRLATIHKTGKPGRPRKLYKMVKPQLVGEKFDLPLGATWDAPELAAVDLSTVMNYKLALLGRMMYFMRDSSRQEQMELWGWSKPTLIRWTREVCDITPQYKRISNRNINFTAPINGADVFLGEVSARERTGSRRYWLEVVTRDGEIRKLPCTRNMAEGWVARSEVVICEQIANTYIVRSAYRDTPLWERGELLPY